MAYAGAKENTSQEIGQLLAKSAPESAVHEYFGALVKAIKKHPRSYTLDIANKMYVMDGLDVLKAFKTVINRHYGGQFEVVDFEESVESAKKINKFVEKATHDKIHDLISPDMLNDMTRLVLINAVYFKGEWANKFRVAFTKKKTFYIDENNTEELDMMYNKTAKFIYFDDKELQLLGMPYRGGEMFMFVLLPKERFGLAKMLAKLDGKSLLKLVKKRSKQEVQVELPKFRLESTHDLNGPLTKLGMSTAFSDSANFEGIADTDEPLKIDKMVQKAFIEVNESGTEAAAATGVVKSRCGASREPALAGRFIADHPFISFITSKTNTILFSLQLLGMPYRGGEMFMFVLLPKERFGLAKMLAKLDGKSLLKLVKKRSKQEVQVELPKFRLESTHDLNGPLTKLGMSTAFTNSANFEGIAATDEPLKIDKMVQKAFIEVNESGTEAAAATGVVKSRCGAAREPALAGRFIADHPFISFITSKTIYSLFRDFPQLICRRFWSN
ncbi:hypothetical protein GPALN_011537 [Globodera pallida]|nr:hypothetical protein GPALN_011537 [Globodera pallida]